MFRRIGLFKILKIFNVIIRVYINRFRIKQNEFVNEEQHLSTPVLLFLQKYNLPQIDERLVKETHASYKYTIELL